jgi:hypothetical protein
LLTIDEKGQNKTVGGDEFYYIYRQGMLKHFLFFASAIALMHDQKMVHILWILAPSYPGFLSNYQLSTLIALAVHLRNRRHGTAVEKRLEGRWRVRAAWKKTLTTQSFTTNRHWLSPYDLVVFFGDFRSWRQCVTQGA